MTKYKCMKIYLFFMIVISVKIRLAMYILVLLCGYAADQIKTASMKLPPIEFKPMLGSKTPHRGPRRMYTSFYAQLIHQWRHNGYSNKTQHQRRHPLFCPSSKCLGFFRDLCDFSGFKLLISTSKAAASSHVLCRVFYVKRSSGCSRPVPLGGGGAWSRFNADRRWNRSTVFKWQH